MHKLSYYGRHRRPSRLLALAAVAAIAAAVHTYTVRDGDTLSQVAASHGCHSWHGLYDRNRSVIGGNPNLIRTGQKLRISCSDPGGVNPDAKAASTGYYRNPLRGIRSLAAERIDMGVDYGGTGPLYAIGEGTIKQTTGGWPGGAYIRERLSHGPFKGKYVYFAENISPAVHVGQHVTASTVLGSMTGGIEVGWGTSVRDTPAAASVYSEGTSTSYGKNFSDLLHALGAPRGKTMTGLAGRVGDGFFRAGVVLHRVVRAAKHVSRPSIAAAIGPVQHAASGMLPANYKVIYAFLRAHGYSKNAAAGVLGNIWQESGGNPSSVGSGGCGLIGWTPCSVPVGNLKAQLTAIISYNNRFGPVGKLNHAGSPAAAAQIYAADFERCGVCVQGSRDAAANAVARALGI